MKAMLKSPRCVVMIATINQSGDFMERGTKPKTERMTIHKLTGEIEDMSFIVPANKLGTGIARTKIQSDILHSNEETIRRLRKKIHILELANLNDNETVTERLRKARSQLSEMIAKKKKEEE